MPLTQPNDRGCGGIGRCGPNGHGIRRAGSEPPTGIGAPRAALLLGLAKLRGGALRLRAGHSKRGVDGGVGARARGRRRRRWGSKGEWGAGAGRARACARLGARCTFISRWARGARSAGSSDAGRGKELLPPPSVLSAAAVPPPLLSAPSPPADGLESGSGEDDGPCETGGCPSGRGDVHGVANRSPWPATAATTTTTATAAAAHLAWGRPRLPAD